MKKSVNLFVIGLVVSLAFLSCENDKTYSYTDEMEKLKSYMVSNNITATATASGMYYIETKAGTGSKPTSGTRVRVRYVGKLLDGTVFDSSPGTTTFDFILDYDNVIKGWHEGIAYMKEGGKATLIIPSFLAYGAQAQGTIPAYSSLIFDVELVGFQK